MTFRSSGFYRTARSYSVQSASAPTGQCSYCGGVPAQQLEGAEPSLLASVCRCGAHNMVSARERTQQQKAG